MSLMSFSASALALLFVASASSASASSGTSLLLGSSASSARPSLRPGGILSTRLRGGGSRNVEFKVKCKDTQPGQSVAIVGGQSSLGNWKAPVKLKPDPFPTWKASIDIDGEAEYKYCMVNEDGTIAKWEIKDKFNRKVKGDVNKQDDGDYGKIPGAPVAARAPPPGGPPVRADDAHGVHLGDAGHINMGGGQPNQFDQAIIDGNNNNGSWRQKLSFVKDFFYDGGKAGAAGFNMENPSTEHLASIAIYLHFLNTNQIPCLDVGGHHRPNHHAMIASAIDEALNKVHKSPATAYLCRKIRPLLPSYSSDYTAQVPLTRIRDIAHRSDIPKWLKDDIKHNLQNKLHRCAGPEDLVTAERIWNNVKDMGDISGPFKEQMWIFMGELKEFFNAGGLDDKLNDALAKNEPDSGARPLIEAFQHEKHCGTAEQRLGAIGRLRGYIADWNRNAQHGEVMQRARLIDVALEQYAFVQLAEAAAHIEGQARSGGVDWRYAAAVTGHALTNAMHSETCDVEEAKSLISESEWVESGGTDMQRVKAWLDRSLRICTSFSDAMQKLFLERVMPLGNGLGVDHHAASVFVEAEVRSNVLFQLSRILSAAMKTAKNDLHAPPWTALQPGSASGKLVEYDSLQQLVDSKPDGDHLIALLRHADGEEDIPPNVKGIVLAQELPLLSHLGVRARQQGVVFACSDGQGPFDELRGQIGGTIGKAATLKVDVSGSVTVKEGGETKAKASQAAPTSGSLVADFDGSAKKVMSCKDAQERTCGAKCAAAGELENIAKNAGFSAPQGCAIPFGVQIQAAERSQKEYEKLCNEFDAKASDGSAAESLAEKVRNLIKKEWKVDDSVVKDIQASVSSGSKVMVRSSANCEDLQKMSGAGLYDSIANVDSSNAGSVAEAVSLVWQSLWTKRAAQSRKAAGMKHSTAVMGVLVQKMVSPTFAFIAFSDNPISRDAGEVYIEMCVGMGETLASAGQPGTPYRFSYSKADKKVTTMALSSFSKALVPQGNSFQLASEQIDYSDIAIHTDSNLRDQVVEKIAQAVMAIAKERGSAQDVEGAIDAEGVMHIVQARPMVLSDD